MIGGFAVRAHLGETHRPTLDVDTAAAPTAHETLVSLGTEGNQEHRRTVAGVKLEIIPVDDPGDDLSGLDDQQKLFITGHWAAANATIARSVQCEELTVTIPVARRLPRIACKLHAWIDRRDARADTRGSHEAAMRPSRRTRLVPTPCPSEEIKGRSEPSWPLRDVLSGSSDSGTSDQVTWLAGDSFD